MSLTGLIKLDMFHFYFQTCWDLLVIALQNIPRSSAKLCVELLRPPELGAT